MPRQSENNFSIINNNIHITRPGWDKIAVTTYREDYFNELSTHSWSLKNGYPYNQALGGYLHRYIMQKWYGEEAVNEFTKRGYIVDHLNNDHMDSRISNLEFLKKCYNTAKGQALDIDSKRLSHRIALNIFKDFSTDYYQITIGCNDPIVGKYPNGDIFYVNSIKLLYTCDYSIVINDAENILLLYESEGRISPDSTNAKECKVIVAPNFELTEEEKNSSIVTRNGQQYFVVGNGHVYINSIYFDEGWKPSE